MNEAVLTTLPLVTASFSLGRVQKPPVMWTPGLRQSGTHEKCNKTRCKNQCTVGWSCTVSGRKPNYTAVSRGTERLGVAPGPSDRSTTGRPSMPPGRKLLLTGFIGHMSTHLEPD